MNPRSERRIAYQPRRSQDAFRDRRVARADLIARLMLAGLAGQVIFSAQTNPESVVGVIAHNDIIGSILVQWLLGICLVLIGADVFVNDLLPARFVFDWPRSRRRWIYFLTGWLFLVAAFGASLQGVSRPAATYLYLLMFASSIALAFRDAIAHRLDADP